MAQSAADPNDRAGDGERDQVTVRPAVEGDLSDIATIYNHEVANSIATFDLDAPTLAYWHEKLEGNHEGDHLLVAVDADDDVVGYAYSWSYRPRPAYELTRETSIYLDPSVRGKGIGRILYPALLEAMARSGVHTAVALVALPNPGSVALHRAVGFEHVGTMREVGYKFDQWIDVEWYQKLLGPS
jgi:phosphinothricin acetyltransferase